MSVYSEPLQIVQTFLSLYLFTFLFFIIITFAPKKEGGICRSLK